MPPKLQPVSSLSSDRYTALQRRLEDLERVHQEGKRAHSVETERLKTGLARYQRQHAEQTELVEKQRKQIALHEARVQELKKAGTSEGAQVKELRSKLRNLERERNKFQHEASQVSELKEVLQNLEEKRKLEIKERDATLSDLENRLALERRSREIASTQYEALKKTVETTSKAATRELQLQLEESREQATRLQDQLRLMEDKAAAHEHDLVQQLEQHRLLITQVASEFGALIARSIPKPKYDEVRAQLLGEKVKSLKLERKLANSDAQVVELTHLARHLKSGQQLLYQQLQDASQELAIFQAAATENSSPSNPDNSFDEIDSTSLVDRLFIAESDCKTNALFSSFYRDRAEQLAIVSSLLRRELGNSETMAERQATHLSETLASHEAIAGRLETVQNQYLKVQEQLAATAIEKGRVEGNLLDLQSKAEAQGIELNTIQSAHRLALNQEMARIQRLTSTTQKHRMAEEGLRDEVERLTTELASLEHYHDAFEQLNERVGSLLTRKKVAEDEAAELCEFNAQILGHHNPAQRIMYVDRIRRELAESKQKIADLLLEQERTKTLAITLQGELDMYKSVMVPPANKPKTHITRVARVPLSSMTQSLNRSNVLLSQPSRTKPDIHMKGSYDAHGDLTVDESEC